MSTAPDIGAFEYNPDEVIVEIPHETDDSGISVFPNPARNRVWIRTDESGRYRVRVLELSGRELFSGQVSLDEKSSYPLTLSSLRAGIYIMEISKGRKSKWEKLIVH